MPAQSLDLLRGTFDLLILKSLAAGPAHGYTIAQWIERSTADMLDIEEGTLYPALHRLERRKLISAEWGVSENNRRARFYGLTPLGRRSMRSEQASWSKLVHALVAAIDAPIAASARA
ncbi:MAG TPA: PadR family transcriptional regulator [Gemmatimonadaceae bacterium]|nr:PadR family transcriptional regulator [Gemmatimonadaceae bacterium]